MHALGVAALRCELAVDAKLCAAFVVVEAAVDDGDGRGGCRDRVDGHAFVAAESRGKSRERKTGECLIENGAGNACGNGRIRILNKLSQRVNA